jgi:hypothetical protein
MHDIGTMGLSSFGICGGVMRNGGYEHDFRRMEERA